MYDDNRFANSRAEFKLEETIIRRRRTVDVAAALRPASDGELKYAAQVFELWSKAEHSGISGLGHAMLNLLDAEQARRDLERAKTLAIYDAMVAELTPTQSDLTGNVEGLPTWAQVSNSEPSTDQ